MTAQLKASQVIPPGLADAVGRLPYWFVIGGQAVRCFAPYRPSRDLDFGIGRAANLDDVLKQRSRQGRVKIQAQTVDVEPV